ncbi:uncharacterized protein GLRG_02973 [Colletotrichum graminicola M1.001]|uniref:Uncharacterized protein n=1 Tax=Colletotrichum graminicola (strain M1.001 / M2 / FGSC 10212) TaxID=645133 RepID=E3QAE1_COLGM|nr:uncharacterized protein GLRG_02973 [Colletotrichum graminicola M1.001]EFQ27829.1 hypothetical protein GLRG_02973 [Colletotrichum graminicola M1.001]
MEFFPLGTPASKFEVTRASADLNRSSRITVCLLVPFVPSTPWDDVSAAITAVFLVISDISVPKPAVGPLTLVQR